MSNESSASRQEPPERALSLRRKGSLRRAQTKHALDGCGAFRSIHSRGGRRRRENQNAPTLGSTAAICLRSTGSFLADSGLPQRGSPPYHGPHQLFRGRPVHTNSIFVDGFALFPQMDVWSRIAVDPIANGSPKANRNGNTYST
jgi:hypothetical protein